MIDEIVFLAGNHYFPNIISTTINFLEGQRPDGIVLELDEERAALRKQPPRDWVRDILQHYPDANVETVRWCVNLRSGLYGAIMAYGQLHRVPVMLGDKNFVFARETRKAKEIVEARMYRRELDKVMVCGEKMNRGIPKELISETMMRDAAIEATGRALDGKVVSINGTGHVYGAYHNLYERFSDVNRQRYTLLEAATFQLMAELGNPREMLLAQRNSP